MSSTASHGEAIERPSEGLNRGDPSVMDEAFHEHALMDWPHLGERPGGAENRRAVCGRARGGWITPRWVFGEGDLWIAEATLGCGEGAVSSTVPVLELRGGRIARAQA